MGFNAIIKIFLPKDKIFYTLFESVAANLVEMARHFKDGIYEENPVQRKAILQTLSDLEHKNDDLTHKVFIELGQNFITPFDREDIHSMAMALDDVADYMFASYKKTINYHVKEHDEFMKELAAIILDSVETLKEAVHELRNMKNLRKITQACVSINSYENHADDVLDKAVNRLFSDSIEAIELIKLKEIYEEMEIVTDKCEDSANVIESIIIKYS